ncbi:MAG: DEAD/DEAH box helicase [Treponema sp.]|nr:DEAD/DEAH box helicase [Treponema sp.]
MNNASRYSRFAPFIREYIYREKWDALHGIQEEAADAVFNGRDHLLIAAGTASGKTEAAFFPVLSVLNTLFRTGGKPLVLYISPLKALINDQARRLERILRTGRDSGEPVIPVWRRHGDVNESQKERFLEDPSGILLITPESLESLLLRRSRELGRIFYSLLFVVIDEVHVFMGSDRGSQLICQLARIEEAKADYGKQRNSKKKSAGCNAVTFRRIGLSATLGDYAGAQRWLSQGSNLFTVLVEGESKSSGKQLSLALDYAASGTGEAFYRSLYDQARNKRAIIFTNSRLEAEECAASLNALARGNCEAAVFRVHHGSVSALFRDEAEEKLKSGEGPQVICATATLELGIDIGDLDRIIQLGPPWSVSAFVQRVGRSGRRSGRAEMYFGITGKTVRKAAALSIEDLTSLPWELLRTMAVIQLYLEEKWIEPPKEKPLPYSLLIHQCLGILASLGEHNPEALIRHILSLPPFKHITPEDFRTLITWLEDCGCIGSTEEGTLILGLEGERIVNRHSFYPIFPGDETFRVVLEGREIGTVNFVPDPLSVLAVGGRRWVVKNIDPGKREIWVAETDDEGSERLWRGRGGGIHRRIAETMRRILAENGTLPYPYLSVGALKALEYGCRAARFLGITGRPLVYDEEETGEGLTLFLFPWTGSAGMRTIAEVLRNDEFKKILRIVFLEEETELYFRIITKYKPEEFRVSLIVVLKRAITAFAESSIRGEAPDFIRRKDLPYRDKYDYLLPPHLLAKQFAANMLDREALENLLTELF